MPGEFELIRRIRKEARRGSQQPFLRMGIGDDCAVFDPSFARLLAVTTDTLVEDMDFRRRWCSPYLLGRKSLRVTLSDLAAMGARPAACLLNLSLPAELSGSFFEAFLKGLLQECRQWGCPLIGGDLSESALVQVVLAAWGSFTQGDPVYRSGGQAGDRILLVGQVGFSRLGLEILERDGGSEVSRVESEEQLDAWAGDPSRLRCLKAHLLPVPQVRVGNWLSEQGLATAMIDVSDGLAADLLHLARESGLAAELELDTLRASDRVPAGADLSVVLDGGEDYALLFTVAAERIELIERNYPPDLPPWLPIGRMVPGKPALYLAADGRRTRYRPRGFAHFR